jgi:hypothetical protein
MPSKQNLQHKKEFPSNLQNSGPPAPLGSQSHLLQNSNIKKHLSQTRVPQIYGIFKLHKQDLKTQPVISSINSIPEIFSKHINWLKKVVGKHLPTYIKDDKRLAVEKQIRLSNSLLWFSLETFQSFPFLERYLFNAFS